jgi:hypothetical protein
MQKVLTNGTEIKSEIISKINSSTKSIKIAIAYFTDQDIANALIEAHKKGVNTRVIVDDSNSNYPMFEYLKAFGILRTHKTSSKYGIMHLKHNLIDDSILLHGTFNYTKNASLNNTESLYITDDKAAIESFSKQFEELHEDSQIISAENTYNEQITESTNTKPTSMTTNTSNEFDTIIDEYTTEIENHVKTIFLPASPEEIQQIGYEEAKSNQGAISTFLMYCEQTLQNMSFEVNQSEQNISRIKTRITNSFENVKARLNSVKEIKVNFERNNSEILKGNLTQNRASLIENKNSAQKSKNDVVIAIETLKSEKNTAQKKKDEILVEYPVKKFWRFPVVFRLMLLLLLIAHLSLFFASAFYKIFLEEEAVLRLLQLGKKPKPSNIYDLDACSNLLIEGGIVYLITGLLFFVIPIILTNIKLFKKDISLRSERAFSFLGLFAFDVIVAFVINFHTHKITNLTYGLTDPWEFTGALTDPSFWLIFMFGALPLFIVKLLLPFVYDAYNNSSLELVNAKRHLEVNNLDATIQSISNDLLLKDSELINKVDVENNLQEEIEKLNREIIQFEKDSLLRIEEINNKVATRQLQAQTICNTFLGDIESGNNLFLGRIVRQRITPYKTGFVTFYNERYSTTYASKCITDLELSENTWFQENFK